MFENAKIGTLVITKEADKKTFKDVEDDLLSLNIANPIDLGNAKIYPVCKFIGAKA